MTYSVSPSASQTSLQQNGTSFLETDASGNVSVRTGGAMKTIADLQSIGIGQTWQQFTVGTQRVVGTTYTNSTGRPIMLKLISSGTSGAHVLTVAGLAFTSISNAGGSGQIPSDTVIPVGATYVVTSAVGTLSWYELRS